MVRLNKLESRAQLARIHSGTEYWVAALGFYPGLASLIALDPRCRLTAPKYNPPRTWTPKGTLGYGGSVTCLYPARTPGGYQIIGHSPVPVVDLEQRLRAFRDRLALLKPGDRVRFVPVGREEYDHVDGPGGERRLRAPGRGLRQVLDPRLSRVARDPRHERAVLMIEVIKAGLETSVQDFPGRYGFWEQGFPPSGPFDMWSFRLANLLVGNAPEVAGLEIQFLGPTLRFESDTVIALTGATMAPKLDGAPIPQWESVAVPAGAVLETGFARIGARAYLAISGGIDTGPVLGSRSTFHMAGVGGMEGHAIKDGQHLPLGADASEGPARPAGEGRLPPAHP